MIRDLAHFSDQVCSKLRGQFNVINFNLMARNHWTICLLFFLFSSVDSSSISENLWSLKLGAEATLGSSWTVFSASIFVFAAIVLSTFLIFQHLTSYNQPEEQKFLIGLILMVLVYALESFLSLVDSNAAFNCEVIRDCYEVFALYCFERYLIACLGGEERTIQFMESLSVVSESTPLLEDSYVYGVVEHPFPLNCCLRSWYLGPDFYHAVKIGTVQYMIMKSICALLSMILQSFGVYGEGKFEWGYGYPYLAVGLNFSQTWALYCLVKFYNVVKHKLEAIKPLPKFLAFKSIVFLTWWQGVVVAFLFSFGVFPEYLMALELKSKIQDYMICIEMCIAAVAHLYVFSALPYKRGERCVRNVAVMNDYACLGSPPDQEEVRDCERYTRIHSTRLFDKEKHLTFPQCVLDVVIGSGEIIADDLKYTVSHVLQPGIAKNEQHHGELRTEGCQE